jgi:Na+/proline symporter
MGVDAERRAVLWTVGLAVALCALYWRRTTLPGAIWGMTAGFTTSIVWVLFLKEHVYGLYEMLPGVAAGLITTIAVSAFTRPPADVDAEFDAVKAAVGHPYLRRRPVTAERSTSCCATTTTASGGCADVWQAVMPTVRTPRRRR